MRIDTSTKQTIGMGIPPECEAQELSEELTKRSYQHQNFPDLSQTHPHLCIRSGLWLNQKLFLLGILLLGIVSIHQHLITAFDIIFIISIIVFCQSIFRINAALLTIIDNKKTPSPKPLLNVTTPTFSLLIPLYREETVAANSVKAISALNYPSNKLEVIYLLEADDIPTQKAIERAIQGTSFRMLVVPNTGPKTKPKALNYGLQRATGDIVSIYDAEDIPHPDQLIEVAKIYSQNDPKLAVVQAPLHAYNGNESWLSGQFELEYAIHFDVWLPAIAKLGWPIPLGGTSNHFLKSTLQSVGAWDAYNVTEDADLGFRLARAGFIAKMINLPTLEEAPVTFSQWLPQRTRWIKGHIQTLMVLTRFPLQTIQALGLWKCFGAMITFISAIFATGIHAPFIVYLLYTISTGNFNLYHPQSMLVLLSYFSVVAATYPSTAWKKRKLSLLTMPFYWPLMSLAFLRAIWELRYCPQSWSKTPHGVSKVDLSTLQPSNVQLR